MELLWISLFCKRISTGEGYETSYMLTCHYEPKVFTSEDTNWQNDEQEYGFMWIPLL